ncbi:guanine nucleotide exchange factor subunit RIC1 isoform X4 [Tachysurus ichikawai]
MYFLTAWPRRLLCPLQSAEQPFNIQPSSQRFYLAVLSDTQISIWFSRGHVQLTRKPVVLLIMVTSITVLMLKGQSSLSLSKKTPTVN